MQSLPRSLKIRLELPRAPKLFPSLNLGCLGYDGQPLFGGVWIMSLELKKAKHKRKKLNKAQREKRRARDANIFNQGFSMGYEMGLRQGQKMAK